jgi:NADH dehydrogenase
MRGLFLTGASGFVGSRLLQLLPRDLFPEVYCLARQPEDLTRLGSLPEGWQAVRGELGDPRTYQSALAQCDTVLHLAAATGKELASHYYSVNAEGTRLLLTSSEREGVGQFIYVSSIAAKFQNERHYHYARSKLQGEAAVQAGSLDYAIVRPTMVLGEGSPVLEGLIRLARGPAAVSFGGGDARVQPIHVDDLVRVLIALLRRRPLGHLMLEAGGPEIITISDLLRRIRQVARGRRGPMIHVPLAPVRGALAMLEPALFSLLPLTAGQLATFANDGIVDDELSAREVASPELDLDAMLAGIAVHA